SLSNAMLPDSAFLMQKDVEHVNQHRKSRPPRVPLYTMADVETTLARFVRHDYAKPFEPFPGVTATYHDAGHILGSAMTTFEFARNGRRFKVLMGGDLGRARRHILRDPEV